MKYFFNAKGASTLILSLTIALSLACSSDDPNPTSGTSSEKPKGRLLVGSETSTAMQIIDLEQSALESQSKTYTANASLVASPEGQFAFVVQSSGNKVDVLKMGTSSSTSTSTTTTTSTDSHGHSHKARFSDGHDHGSTSSSSSSSSSTDSSSTSTTSSVDAVDISITGTNLGKVVSKGKWIAVQFQSEVVVLSEEKLESNLNSLTETTFHKLTTTLPGVPLDEEHIALGPGVVEISDGSVVDAGGNTTALALTSANILSASRSAEKAAVFGTDQGALIVAQHTENGTTAWEDFMVPYPVVAEANIFLAGDHAHEGEEEHSEEEGEDEHKEVEENRAATAWATHDALGHAFAHLTHENHSAGIFLIEASTLEPDAASASSWEYLDGTSSSASRPVAMDIAQVTKSDNSTGYYLLILMSDGSLRVHDAKDEGKFIRVITGLIPAMTDFHAGEGNYPSITSGLGKAYIGNPSTNLIYQIDLTSFQTELTWSVSQKPNRLLFLGQSTLAEGSSHSHDHD